MQFNERIEAPLRIYVRLSSNSISSFYHILVVDDDDAVRHAVAELLRTRGYEVCVASNEAQALYFLKRQATDVVVLDIELGTQDGLGLLAAIKTTAPQVRVVILTGCGYDELLWQSAREKGADAYLSKSLPPSQLLLEVKRLVRPPAAPRPVPPGPSPSKGP